MPVAAVEASRRAVIQAADHGQRSIGLRGIIEMYPREKGVCSDVSLLDPLEGIHIP
jgi:hypothetical protein